MSDAQISPRKPAAWVFLALLAATGLSAAIAVSMLEAPQMLEGHASAGAVRLFLAIGAVYLGMPITWILGLASIAFYPRQTERVVSKGSLVAAGIWTIALAVPYVAALLR